MTRLAAGLALLALAVPALPVDARADDGAGTTRTERMRGYANPSAAIAAELAFARLAQEKGQWTAFRETAAEDAVMFAPAMVPAQQWLKNRADPAVPLAWEPHRVWSSCDGSLMVTTGGWQRPDGKGATTHGWFTTVWQRQDKGGYKWVFDHGDETAAPVAAPEMIAARVADCPERRRDRASAATSAKRGKPAAREKAPTTTFDPAQAGGRSDDGTLVWRVTVAPDGTRDFTAAMRVDGAMEDIRNEHVSGA